MARNLLLSLTIFLLNAALIKQNITFVQAASPTAPKTIKLQNFTPPPTRTPTITPKPSITPTSFPIYSPPVYLSTTANPTNQLKPTPTESINPPQQKAADIIALVNEIRNKCASGIISISNLSCINNLVLPSAMAALAKSELIFSTTNNNFLQCVGFIRSATALKYGAPLNNGGDAIDFAVRIPTNYRFIDKNLGARIRVDDIPIWDSDTNGHIAYVVQVYNRDVFQVAEANLGVNGRAQLRITTIDSPNLIGWLRRI